MNLSMDRLNARVVPQARQELNKLLSKGCMLQYLLGYILSDFAVAYRDGECDKLRLLYPERLRGQANVDQE
jgi:hypothetical protein